MRVKEKLTVAVLAVLLLGGMALQLLLPDQEFSRSERRKLDQRPEFTTETLLSGKYATKLEDYFLDQFPLRDGFRTLKSIWTYYILGQRDNNKIFISEGTVSKLDDRLDPKQVQMFVTKFSQLHEKFFPESQVTAAIVPDKNFYLTDGKNYPRLDYETLYTTVAQGMPWAEHVDLTDALEGNLYYTTDSHWRQENLQRVVDRLSEALKIELPKLDTYRQTVLPGFHGVYYGQAALPMPAEDLIYLENEVTDAAVVTGPELKGEHPVYDPARFEGMDGYDVFLHGAQAILNIQNPLGDPDKELLVFRDSFGSSLTPLLLSAYGKITLVDIRYVNSAMLNRMVDFHGQDVLILYSTTLVNGAAVLK